jgi:hypothetical protein
VGLIAKPVARLGCRGSVVAEAVRLDDEAEVGPEEVDLEAVHPCFRSWWREASAFCDRPKENLQGRVGQPEGVSVEEAAKTANPGFACVVEEGDM